MCQTPALRSAGTLPAVARTACPRMCGRDAPTTAAETAALQFITAIALHESRDVTASTAYPGESSVKLERVDLGKMNPQLVANVENQDRTQGGKNQAGGMIAFVFRARKHMGNGAAKDRSDNAQHDRPEDRHMDMHHRFRNNPRN